MNRLNLNLNYRDLNMLLEVYLTIHPMLVGKDQRTANSDHVHRLQYHRIDLLIEDLFHGMDVEHRV